MPVFQLSNRTPSQSQTNRKYPQAMPAMGDKLPRVHSFKGVKGNAGFGPSPRLRAVRVSSVNPHADIEEAEEGTEWSEADIQINDQFDAVLHESSAPETVVQPGKPLNGAFGIPWKNWRQLAIHARSSRASTRKRSNGSSRKVTSSPKTSMPW